MGARVAGPRLIPRPAAPLEPVPQPRSLVVAAVERLDGPQVILSDGTRLAPDVVVAATGFRRGLEELVGHLGILGKHGRPVVHGPVTHPSAPGLYFIGYTNPISGNLRELGIDARRIARAAARRIGRPRSAAG